MARTCISNYFTYMMEILIPVDPNTVGQFQSVTSPRSLLNLLELLSRSASFARKQPELAGNTSIL